MTGSVADTGPSGTAESVPAAGPAGAGTASRQRVVLVAVAVVTLAAGLALGLLLAGGLLRPDVPVEGSVDAGFARDMQVHHDQAVEMSVLVRERSSDEAVRTLALDILLTQQHQQGQMFGWLRAWGLPAATSQPAMAWKDPGDHDGAHTGQDGTTQMPGLLSPEQMDRLARSDGAQADRLYLALMIPHHVGGVEMAQAAQERAGRPEVRRFAEAIVTAQQAELTVLEEMLTERGGPPADL